MGLIGRLTWLAVVAVVLGLAGAELRGQSNYTTPFTFTTLAGIAGQTGSADGTGSTARFNYPSGVAVDGSGNVYVADSSNHTIRKITASGVVTTLAGIAGQTGSADGTGSAARFNGPNGVAVDGAGNVYVADLYNDTIRKITAGGVVTTLAGTAGQSGSADGTGSSARFYWPNGVAVDGSGNVYVADTFNHTIRKVTATGVVTTLAGSAGLNGSADGSGSTARFEHPRGVAVDGTGNVYVADNENYTIRKITAGGAVTTLAGTAGYYGSTDGIGYAPRFYLPSSVAVDGTGNVYVADSENDTIRKITAGGVVTTLAGSPGISGNAEGTGSAARFTFPYGVAVDGLGNVYVADYYNDTIRKGGFVPIAPAVIAQPQNQAVIAGQNTSFTVTASGTPPPTFLWQVSADGGTTWTNLSDSSIYSGSATANLTVTNASVSLSGEQFQCVATNAAGSATSNPATLTVNRLLSITTLAGSPLGSAGSADGMGGTARFWSPHGVAVNGAGNVYVADSGNDTIRKITAGGVVATLAGIVGVTGSTDGTSSSARFNGPSGVAVDGSGNVYVADSYNDTIRKITASGVVTTLAGSPGVSGTTDGTGSAARFNGPAGVAVDGTGNVYVADSGNDTIRKITASGVVTTLAGSPGVSGSTDGTGSAARFNYPQGVAVDGAGNVYVADGSNCTIRKITVGGVVTTLAGSAGVIGSADGTGSAARFNYTSGVAVDGAGNVYVADSYNDTIRKITANGVVTTLAGSAGVTGNAEGTGIAARFHFPTGVAVDGLGNVYVADYYNDTIRKGVFVPYAPAVNAQPQNQAMTAGQNASFTVYFNGNPVPTFLWQVSADGGTTWISLSDNSIYSGSATTTLTVTNATVSLNGYQFQCVATNTAGSATSNPATLTVTKGTATVTLGGLSQTYSGSALGAMATTSPGGLTVTFSYNGSATVPTAPGSYSVVATVSDANYQGTASGTLIIQPNFASWSSQSFTTAQLADATISGPTANPAHDGVVNLLKYAFGLDPTAVAAPTGLPVASRAVGALTLSFIRRKDVADLVYTVEVSSDLVTWQSGPGCTLELSVTALDAKRDQVVVSDLTPLSGTTKRFIRLRVTQQ